MTKHDRGGAATAWIVFVFVIAAIATTASVWPPGRERQPGVSCTNNIGQLAACFGIVRKQHGLEPTLHGSAQILSWIGPLKEGEERVLVCPGDPHVSPPETAEERRPYHPADAAALRRAVGLGSYAVRDFEKFPLDDASMERQMILCDRQGNDGRTMHHRTTIVVAYAEGNVEKLTGEELGFAPGEPIVVGPDSPNAELRKMERP